MNWALVLGWAGLAWKSAAMEKGGARLGWRSVAMGKEGWPWLVSDSRGGEGRGGWYLGV